MKIKVVHKNLGKEKIWGKAILDDMKIELDSRLVGKKHCEIAIHEALHLLNWEWSEQKVKDQAKALTDVMWRSLRYRRIDDRERQPKSK